jgi:NADH:ubiquinone oxidoreductase subunit 6 (subunit J)
MELNWHPEGDPQRGVCQTIKNESLKILITIFGLLFLLERKPMNLLFNYIGLILSVALLLGFYNADYISYLLIIIYCSALTIIFGFVLMLCPTEPEMGGGIWITLMLFVPLCVWLFWTSDTGDGPVVVDGLIYKIGELLYLDPINILKFMLCTLLLFLALLALFFILG